MKPLHDPLLIIGSGIALLAQIAMAIGGIALAVAIPGLLVFRATVAELVGEASRPDLAFPLLTLAGVMLIGLAVVVLLFVFFGRLRQIIATVDEGDPFEPANADRLSLMGWLMLGVQLLFIPAVALGQELGRYADSFEEASLTVDGGLDITGILLVVILFILARVFRHGAAMRADLEGTV